MIRRVVLPLTQPPNKGTTLLIPTKNHCLLQEKALPSPKNLFPSGCLLRTKLSSSDQAALTNAAGDISMRPQHLMQLPSSTGDSSPTTSCDQIAMSLFCTRGSTAAATSPRSARPPNRSRTSPRGMSSTRGLPRGTPPSRWSLPKWGSLGGTRSPPYPRAHQKTGLLNPRNGT